MRMSISYNESEYLYNYITCTGRENSLNECTRTLYGKLCDERTEAGRVTCTAGVVCKRELMFKYNL